jgi:hypothetical protein
MCDPAEPQPEDLLNRWLHETDEEKGREALRSLIALHAEPVVRRIVSFKLSGGATHRNYAKATVDVDDVCNDALRNLLSHLGVLKAGAQQTSVRNFGNYVAVTAFNACNEYFRENSPARYRLANKLRYLLTHSTNFALWETSSGKEVAGTAAMKGQESRADPAELGHAREILPKVGSGSFIEIVLRIFRTTNTPLTFENLLDLVAHCADIQEARANWEDDDAAGTTRALEQIPGTEPGAEKTLVGRQYIARLWAEICELPMHQRGALLLNLRDSAGGDIQLFDWLGIATVRQIGDALEIEAEHFAQLWKELPLDDARVARELGIGRQDVINRRSSARKRLANRMKEYALGK